MSIGLNDEWFRALSDWMSQEDIIAKAWCYGSRVKGSHTPESDLDVAIQLTLNGDSMTLAWITHAARWKELAQSQIGSSPKVHLEVTDPESDDIVWPAIQDHGLQIYPNPPKISISSRG